MVSLSLTLLRLFAEQDDQAKATFPLLLPLQASRASRYRTPSEHSYGEHERHVLDVYRPHQRRKPGRWPVLIFLHGGGFARGDKRVADGVYSGLGDFFASKGFITVIPNYRLLQHGATFPSGAEDLSFVLSWLARESLAEADLHNVFLLGESAGGMHLATYMYGAFSHIKPHSDVPGLVVRGVAFLNAPFFVDQPVPASWLTYYGNSSQYEQSCPLSLRKSSPEVTPVLLIRSQHDLPQFLTWFEAAEHAISAIPSVSCKVIEANGHNHISPGAAIGLGSPADDWAFEMLTWMSELSV